MAVAKKNSRKPSPKEQKPAAPNGSGAMTRQALIFFVIGACMFTLGIFVGRGTAPVRFDIEKLQKELAQLREAVIKKETQQVNIYRQAIDKKAQLDFYEELKKTGAPGKMKPFQDAQTDKPVKPNATQKTAKRTAPVKTEMPRTTKNAKPRGNLTIQVASVKDVKAADEMVAGLKQKGYPAHRIISKIPGKGIWFRVRVGSYARKSDTASTLKRLKRDRFSPMVVNANY